MGEDAKEKGTRKVGSPVSSRFIFVFAFSLFSGPDYLGAWNRLRKSKRHFVSFSFFPWPLAPRLSSKIPKERLSTRQEQCQTTPMVHQKLYDILPWRYGNSTKRTYIHLSFMFVFSLDVALSMGQQWHVHVVKRAKSSFQWQVLFLY